MSTVWFYKPLHFYCDRQCPSELPWNSENINWKFVDSVCRRGQFLALSGYVQLHPCTVQYSLMPLQLLHKQLHLHYSQVMQVAYAQLSTKQQTVDARGVISLSLPTWPPLSLSPLLSPLWGQIGGPWTPSLCS